MKIQHKTKTNKARKLIISVEAFCLCWSISTGAIRGPISPLPPPLKIQDFLNSKTFLKIQKFKKTTKFFKIKKKIIIFKKLKN